MPDWWEQANGLNFLSRSDALIDQDGDLLTNLNYAKLLRFQQENDYALVMCVRRYKIQVPYGVVQIGANGQIGALHEKPVHEHFINAGIYVMKPSCLDCIPQQEYFDMTDLTQRLIERGESVGAFPRFVLAAGDYSVIARQDGRTFNRDFSVEPGIDGDIEVVANSANLVQ